MGFLSAERAGVPCASAGERTSSASVNQSMDVLSLLPTPNTLCAPAARDKHPMAAGHGSPSPGAPFARGQHPVSPWAQLSCPARCAWEPRRG